MKVAIHQPQYFPWPPYVHKVIAADIFVYLDTVQFSKNGLQNRNQIKSINGPVWLTVPVKQQLGQTISQTQVARAGTTAKHLKTIGANYAHTAGYKRWRDELAALLQTETESLAELSIASTEWMLDKLEVQTKRVRASEIADITGHGSKLVSSICGQLSASEYLSGKGGLDYMNPEDFATIGCRISIQQWKPLSYPQQHGEFIPDLSTLDLLLNCPDEARAMIESSGSWTRLT